MRRSPFLISILVVCCCLVLAGAAQAQRLAHFHGFFVSTMLGSSSKAPEAAAYTGFFSFSPSRTSYFVLGTCEVFNSNGQSLRNGRFRCSRASVESDTVRMSLPDVNGKWGTIVAKEVRNLSLFAGEAVVGAANVRLNKNAKFGYDVDCVCALGEIDDRVLSGAKSAAEREAIVSDLASRWLGRDRERPAGDRER